MAINGGGCGMNQKKKRPQYEAHIAGDIPGRMRIKLRPGGRQPAFMNIFLQIICEEKIFIYGRFPY
jgi:hypothetical protein